MATAVLSISAGITQFVAAVARWLPNQTSAVTTAAAATAVAKSAVATPSSPPASKTADSLSSSLSFAMRIDANPLLQRRQQQQAKEFYKPNDNDDNDEEHRRPDHPRTAFRSEDDDMEEDDEAVTSSVLQRRNTLKNIAARPELDRSERPLGKRSICWLVFLYSENPEFCIYYSSNNNSEYFYHNFFFSLFTGSLQSTRKIFLTDFFVCVLEIQRIIIEKTDAKRSII